MQYSETIYGVDPSKRLNAAVSIDVLLLSDNPRNVSKVRSTVRGVVTNVACMPSLEQALRSLNDEHFDLIIVDRHLGGWLSPQACKALVTKAAPIPVVGLINKRCVLDLRDGIEAGLLGVYYTDQIDAPSMRRLSRYAHLPRRKGQRHQAAARRAAPIVSSVATNARWR
jgi:CheY-like chemotaxis protein